MPFHSSALDIRFVLVQFQYFGIASTSSQCHVSSIPVYVGLKKRTLPRFTIIVVAAVFICFIVYTLTGTFGYLTFHPQRLCIQSDILRNYCPENVLISVARGMLAFVMVTSYPILTFCGR